MRNKRNYSGGNRNRGRNNNRGRGGNDNQSLARQKKHALTQKEKYLNQARDALSQGDRVTAEYFYQHVEHYSRVVGEIIEKEPKPEPRDNDAHNDADDVEANSADDAAEAQAGDDANGAAEEADAKPKRAPRKPRAKKEEKVTEIPLPDSMLPKAADDGEAAEAASS